MAIALAIDLGTTNLKVGLVDETGKILDLRSAPSPVVNNGAGGAEHNPEQLKSIILGLCKQLLNNNIKEEIAYIVSSTYQFGLMMLDAQKKPVTGITLLADIRSQKTFNNFLADFSDVDIYSQTGCPLMSPYLLPRLYYFSKQEQAVFAQAKYFTDSKSFLFEWLTGEFVTDTSTAAASQLYNLHTHTWDDSILSRLNLKSNQFPEVKDGTNYLSNLKEDIRQELGLKSSVKVVLGLYDGAALAVGLGALENGIGIMNVGTSAMLRVPQKSPAFDKSDNKRIQPYAINNSMFFNGGALNNAALPLNWLSNNLFDFDIQDPSLQKISKEPPLISLPYLTSERDSKTGPYASGSFFGLRQYHTKLDLTRAVLEGVAYSMRYIYDALKENNLAITELRMGGGGANIKAWPQLFADVLGISIKIPSGEEMGLVGSAMLAFVAGGLYKDVQTLGLQIIKMDITIEPNLDNIAIHEQRYQFFKKLRETLGPLYKEHADLSL